METERSVSSKNEKKCDSTFEGNTSFIEKYPIFFNYVETKKFEVKNENSLIRITPSILNFIFYIDSRECIVLRKEIKILNISSHPVKILVLPPQTEYFRFDFVGVKWLVSGMSQIIKVTFQPTCSRHYNEWFRVICSSDCNLMVIIRALPEHINLPNIPQKINFGFVPVGHTAAYTMVLQPIQSKIFRFMFVIATDIPGCKIIPSAGTVNEEPVEIKISYCASSFITVSIPVQLYMPPISMIPYYFTVEAHTKPFIAREKPYIGLAETGSSQQSSEARYEMQSIIMNSTSEVKRSHESFDKPDITFQTLIMSDSESSMYKNERLSVKFDSQKKTIDSTEKMSEKYTDNVRQSSEQTHDRKFTPDSIKKVKRDHESLNENKFKSSISVKSDNQLVMRKHERLRVKSESKKKNGSEYFSDKHDLRVKTLTKHDVNIFLIKKSIPEQNPEEQLGPYGIYMDESEKLKEKSYKKFLEVVEQYRQDDEIARLVDKMERTFTIGCPPELRNEIFNENLALRDEYQARLNPVNEDIYPVYIRQKVIRKYEKIEYPAPVTEENNTGMWYIRFKRFCKFVEACRIVLIQCRMLRRLEILKKLTPEKILELENDEE